MSYSQIIYYEQINFITQKSLRKWGLQMLSDFTDPFNYDNLATCLDDEVDYLEDEISHIEFNLNHLEEDSDGRGGVYENLLACYGYLISCFGYSNDLEKCLNERITDLKNEIRIYEKTASLLRDNVDTLATDKEREIFDLLDSKNCSDFEKNEHIILEDIKKIIEAWE